MNDEQLTQRMRAASQAVQLSESAQARHLEAISTALESASVFDADVIPLATAEASRRRRIIASVVAAAVMAPAGLAAASEGSLPGDALYPVKQVSERLLVLFDSDVIAEHRIEEIEVLQASGRTAPELYDEARIALTELGEDHPLWQRLAAVSSDDDGTGDQEISDDDDRSEAESTIVVEVALPDGSKATITLAGDELLQIDAPTGWTVTDIDDDDATLESDSHIVGLEVGSDGSIDLIVHERDSDDDESDEPTATTADVPDDHESEAEGTSTTAPDREDDTNSTDDDTSELP